MVILANIIDLAITVYIWIIVIHVAVTWLIAFDVINASNQQAQNLMALLKKATDPVFKPLQKYVPPIGGIDITPLVVILGLVILRNALLNLIL